MDVARQLFAKNGVDETTMNDIATASKKGRRTLYTYFKSKEEILNVLINQVEGYYATNLGSEMNVGKIPDTVEELINRSLERIEFTLHDETIKKVRRILSMEQFRNPHISQIATRHSIDSIQGMYRKIFEGMMDAGIIKKDDPHMLSISFTAPVTLLIQMCDREPERENEVMDRIKAYLDYAVRRLF